MEGWKKFIWAWGITTMALLCLFLVTGDIGLTTTQIILISLAVGLCPPLSGFILWYRLQTPD